MEEDYPGQADDAVKIAIFELVQATIATALTRVRNAEEIPWVVACGLMNCEQLNITRND